MHTCMLTPKAISYACGMLSIIYMLHSVCFICAVNLFSNHVTNYNHNMMYLCDHILENLPFKHINQISVF